MYLLYHQLSVCLQSLQGVSFYHRPALAGSLLSHPSGMPTDSPSCIWFAQYLAVVTFLKRKNGLIQHAEQAVFAYVTDVLDMFPLHEPESRTINCMQLSSFYAKRKSPSDQVWKQSERLLTNIYNRATMKHDIAIALSQSGAELTSLMMGCIWIGVHLHPV